MPGPPVYREEFVPDVGYRLFRDRVSFHLGMLAPGRPLDRAAMIEFTRAFQVYSDAIAERESNTQPSLKILERRHFPIAGRGPFFKFVTEEAWSYLARGSLRLGSVSCYRAWEAPPVGDPLEGSGMFHLVDRDYQIHAQVYAGMNWAMLCGTGRHDGPSDPRREDFGSVLVEISNPAEFAGRVRDIIGANRFTIKDVVYSDLKNFRAKATRLRDILSNLGTGNMTNETLRNLNERYFGLFYKTGILASLFTKPMRYAVQRERRIAFELPEDLREPYIQIEDESLAKMMRRVPVSGKV